MELNIENLIMMVPWFARSNLLYKDIGWGDRYESGIARVTTETVDAELISSLTPDGKHIPVLDVDMDVGIVSSSTVGHYHLYINKPMSWWAYKRLLRALARAGVVEKGWVKASIQRGHSDVRLPWIKKA